VWTLCVAPLDPSTQLDRLLWAIDQLGVVHKGLEHVLVGTGPLLARVCRRARLQHLAERLFVLPTLDCLPDLLPRVRLVWQPGEVAGAGCLLDGMAHGIAAVAVESEAACGIVADDVSGRIVAADPISEFPRRALGIIEDDALAARYGSAGRIRAATEFPVARSTGALLASVERAIAGGRRRR
jgi:glycosyltransferase involved in cell wall biosynthesis